MYYYLKTLTLALVILVSLGAWVDAQPFVASVRTYGTEQGLADREVNAIFQDRRGFMWFGTRFGLTRFDGATFTTFTKDRNGLDFDDIRSIAQDAEGILWLMGTSDKSKITLFNPITGQATSFGKLHHQFRSPEVVLETKTMLSGEDGTIFLTDYAPAKLTVYYPRSGLRSVALPQYKTLTLVAVTSRHTVWAIADQNQLIELTPAGRVVRQYAHSTPIKACTGQPNAGTEFIYRTVLNPSRPEQDPLYRIDVAGRRQALPLALTGSGKMQRPVSYSFDESGLIWNGSQLRDSTGRIALDIGDQLASDQIDNRSFFRDKNGGIWLGTSFGLYQIHLRHNYFQRLFYQPDSSKVKQIGVRGMTTVGNTLYTNQEGLGFFASTRLGKAARRLLSGKCYGLSDTVAGKLYVHQLDDELVAYDYRRNRPHVMLLPRLGGVWTIHPFSTSPRRLLAGGDPGLWLVDVATQRVLPFQAYNQFTELAQAHVLHIGPDRTGTLWLCTSTGLYTIDPEKGVTGRYWSGGRGSFRLPTDSYQHFYQDSGGLFWLATANAGLIRWDRSHKQYRQFKRADGLNNDNIYAVYADRRGHLWLSSDYGLMQFDPHRLTTQAYTVQEGITHNEFNRIAHHQDKQGRLYFGGLNGITAFDPRDFESEPPPPPLPLRVVAFHQFDSDSNRLIDKTEELIKTSQIAIMPNDRSSVLDFALLNYTDAPKNRYAYQLEGVDDTWRYQTEPSLRLGNLPYGEHQLLIRGQAADGRLSSETLTLSVRVLRPFYLRAWFAIPLVLLLLGGSWAWGRWRAWQYEQAKIRLQTQINEATGLIARQAQDLLRLDETKSRFFANISHEFRTPLTIILGMAESLKEQGDPGLQQKASLIERSGRNLLRLINQILDLSRLEAGAMPMSLVRGDLIRFVHYVGESFHSVAHARGVQMVVDAQVDHCEADFNPDKLQDILANLLGNALKFTPAGGEVRCVITILDNWQPLAHGHYHEALTPSLHQDGPWIQITVSDTGPGIDAASLPRIFDRFYQAGPRKAGPEWTEPSVSVPAVTGTGIGLSLVRELVSLMQGGLAVRNRPDRSGAGGGAEFIVRLPLTRQAPLADELLPAPPRHTSSPGESDDWVDQNPDEATDRPVLLLVEDNEDVATYIQTILQTEPYQIVRAENGQTGIDQALALIPDLILSDVMMPVKDGFALCDTLKNDERTSHIPIVLLTARAAPNDRMAGLRRGANAYLVKPFQREELVLVLSNLLQARHRLQRYYSQRALGDTERNSVPVGEVDPQEDAFVVKLRDTLHLHLANPQLDSELICQLMGMSRNTLRRKVTALTGMSITPYLRALRMEKARSLLAGSTIPISEVAYAVGFEDPRYFSRIFTEETGISPSQYRRFEP